MPSPASGRPPWLPDAVLEHLREAVRGAGEGPGPTEIGHYELISVLGQGGMGTVYLARDRRLDREVALKVLHVGDDGAPPGDAGTAGDHRLLAEARILARLEHPGLVPVHDLGRLPDGRIFYAMKRVRGVGLDRFAGDRRAAGRAELLRVFERICETVAFAHAHGVIHRDLKPQNVMVGAFGEVLVLDWGLAKQRPPMGSATALAAGVAPSNGSFEAAPAAGAEPAGVAPAAATPAAAGDTAATAAGMVLGTPGYMAPEQSRGPAAAADERSDVFALGAILSFLLTGSPAAPSEGPADHDGARAEPEGSPGRFSEAWAAVPRVPPPLAAICRKAMAPEPRDRYAGAAALATELGRFLAGQPVDAYPETPMLRVWRLARRHATPLLLLLAYVVVRVLILLLARR